MARARLAGAGRDRAEHRPVDRPGRGRRRGGHSRRRHRTGVAGRRDGDRERVEGVRRQQARPLRRGPQPARHRRRQPDVGAPEIRRHPSVHHGRRPGGGRRPAGLSAGTGLPRLLRRGATCLAAQRTVELEFRLRRHRGRPGCRRPRAVRALEIGSDGVPHRGRRNAPTRRNRVHAQPGPDDHRVAPGQGSASAVAMGSALVSGTAGRRGHGQQSARLAVGGRLWHRRRAVLSGVQPDTQGRRFDPDGAYVRRWVPEYGGPEYPEPMVDHAVERGEALRRYARIR